MVLIDAAFVELPRRAKILPVGAARAAVRIGTRAPDRRHHEIADGDAFHLRAGVRDFAERFVTEHEVIGARRRRAIDKRADLAVRAADADIKRLDANLGGLRDFGSRVFEERDLFLWGTTPTARIIFFFIKVLG